MQDTHTAFPVPRADILQDPDHAQDKNNIQGSRLQFLYFFKMKRKQYYDFVLIPRTISVPLVFLNEEESINMMTLF